MDGACLAMENILMFPSLSKVNNRKLSLVTTILSLNT